VGDARAAGAEAQIAGAPKSNHDGKTGYDTLVARMGLNPFLKYPKSGAKYKQAVLVRNAKKTRDTYY